MDLTKIQKVVSHSLHTLLENADCFGYVLQYIARDDFLNMRHVNKSFLNIIDMHPCSIHTVKIDSLKNLYFLEKFVKKRSKNVKNLIIKESCEIHSLEMLTSQYDFTNVISLDFVPLEKAISSPELFETLNKIFPLLEVLKGKFSYHSSGGFGRGRGRGRPTPEKPKVNLNLRENRWCFNRDESSTGSIVRGSFEEHGFPIGNLGKLETFEGIVCVEDLIALGKTNHMKNLEIKIALYDDTPQISEKLEFTSTERLSLKGICSKRIEQVLKHCFFPNVVHLELYSGKTFSLHHDKEGIIDLSSLLLHSFNLTTLRTLKTNFPHSSYPSSTITKMTNLLSLHSDGVIFSMIRGQNTLESLENLKMDYFGQSTWDEEKDERRMTSLRNFPNLNLLKNIQSLSLNTVHIEHFQVSMETNPNLREIEFVSCEINDLEIDGLVLLEEIQIFGRVSFYKNVSIDCPNLIHVLLGCNVGHLKRLRTSSHLESLNISEVNRIEDENFAILGNVSTIDILEGSVSTISQLADCFPSSIDVKSIRFSPGESNGGRVRFDDVIMKFGSVEELCFIGCGNDMFQHDVKLLDTILSHPSVKKLSFLHHRDGLNVQYLMQKFSKCESLKVHCTIGSQWRYDLSAPFYMDDLYDRNNSMNNPWTKSLKCLDFEFGRVCFRDRKFLEKIFECYSEVLESFKIKVTQQRNWKRPKVLRRREDNNLIHMKKLNRVWIGYEKLYYILEEIVCDRMEFVHVPLTFQYLNNNNNQSSSVFETVKNIVESTKSMAIRSLQLSIKPDSSGMYGSPRITEEDWAKLEDVFKFLAMKKKKKNESSHYYYTTSKSIYQSTTIPTLVFQIVLKRYVSQ